MSIFAQNEIAILNDKVTKGLPNRVGEKARILGQLDSFNYDYQVQFDDLTTSNVREKELNKLTEQDKEYMKYIYQGNTILSKLIGEIVHIVKVDYLNRKVEIKFEDDSCTVTDFNDLESLHTDNLEEKQGKFTKLGLEIGKFTDSKNKQYGSSVDATYEMIQVLMKRYEYDEKNYLIPKSLLQHLLLQVRIMDKQNRIFNNPEGKKDSESPYNDITGYGLIGIDMVNEK